MKVRRLLRANSLGLFFALIFVLALAGQAIAGHAQYNQEELSQGLEPISMLRYLTSSSFAADVAENWQSEYLQFLLYLVGTVWLIQRGSPESKKPEERGLESDKDQLVGSFAEDSSPKWAKVTGWRRSLYSSSLGLVVGAVFLLSWAAQSVTGHVAYNEEQLGDLEQPISWAQYAMSPDFWNRTLQNWQSEFLAVGSFAVLAVYLRQRGSPESKPVGAPHYETGTEG